MREGTAKDCDTGSNERTVHFVVTGEAMTELARNLLLSDEPGKAYRLIADMLIGEGAIEAALSVLAGTHDLAGDSNDGLELVEAEDNESLRQFKADFRYIYAGRHRSNLGWRRPTAFVQTFVPEDARKASGEAATGTRAWWKERALCYAEEGETVESLKLSDGGDAWVIWEPCGEMPQWMIPSSTTQESLDDALAAGRMLQERMDYRARESIARANEDVERGRQREKQILEIGEKVRAQAGDDTFVLELKDGRKLTVPRAPFIRWSLCRTDQLAEAPRWVNVAPIGMKMQMDNQDHTDWVLGSGISLDEAYSECVNDAAWDAAFKFQEGARNAKLPYPGIRAAMELLSNMRYPAATIVDAGERVGVVGIDIAVFPDSQGSRASQLDGIIGVIVEKGGALAHFAIVSKGRGVTVMRHSEACETFKDGTRVQLSPHAGRIVILEEDEDDDAET